MRNASFCTWRYLVNMGHRYFLPQAQALAMTSSVPVPQCQTRTALAVFFLLLTQWVVLLNHHHRTTGSSISAQIMCRRQAIVIAASYRSCLSWLPFGSLREARDWFSCYDHAVIFCLSSRETWLRSPQTLFLMAEVSFAKGVILGRNWTLIRLLAYM